MTDIYHNPRCSKSRQTLALLEQHNIQANVIDYLTQAPDIETLKTLIKQLGITPRDLLRKSEAIYKELGLKDASLSDAELLQAMATHPKLIERPIVVHNNLAKIGRPPEAVLDLFTS